MLHPLLILVLTQGVYTVSDLMGRYYMRAQVFEVATFLTPWFVGYFVLRQVAMLGQLYVFAHMPLGKTIAVLSAVSIVLSNVVGILFLKEVLTPVGYAGVMLAILAIVVLAFK